MHRENFFKDARLPFAEGRYSRDSRRVLRPHLRRRFSIGAVDAGEVISRMADREVCRHPGALARINPETLHCCNSIGAKARSYGMLHLAATLFKQCCRTTRRPHPPRTSPTSSNAWPVTWKRI